MGITVPAADSVIIQGSASLISVHTTSRWAPRRNSASKPIDRTTMKTGRNDFFMKFSAENSASTIRGVRGNAKNALVVVAAAAKLDLPLNRVPDKIGAFRLPSRF